MRIYVGTCSWSDHTGFYPPGLPSNQQIGYYAQHFSLVEINSSYYRMMPERNYALWAERTPPGFVFDIKPYKQITWHDRQNPPEAANTAAFSKSIGPLREADKLGVINCQFPPWYVYRPENVSYILGLRQAFPDDQLSVEFRHRSWLVGDHVPELVSQLHSARLGLTIVDEPQLGMGSVPTVLAVTNPATTLVRFHGRNAQMWYAKVKTTGERFDYLYSGKELGEWVPRIHELAAQGVDELHLLFNNNAADYAIQNARQLNLMLENEGLDVANLA